MNKKFFLTLSAVAFALIMTAGIHAQTRTVNLENIPADKTETRIYDKNGKLLYSVYRYDETELPKEVKSLVRREYSDYDIAGVEEVKTPGNLTSIYFVHVQNETTLKVVKIFNGETELVKEYKRG